MNLCKGKRLNENVNDAAKTELAFCHGTTSFSGRTRSRSIGTRARFLARLHALFHGVDLRAGHYSSSRTPRLTAPGPKKRAIPRFATGDASNRGFDAYFRFVSESKLFPPRYYLALVPFYLCFFPPVLISPPFFPHFPFLFLFGHRFTACLTCINELKAWVSLPYLLWFVVVYDVFHITIEYILAVWFFRVER